MEKRYYLGLDMGTSSVGWAVTDPSYRLLRAKGKDLWGVHLFAEAKTAAERRVYRTSRRRRQREQVRIGYLREFFADEIAKVDPGFYQRMDDSKYFPEDKSEKQPFALFADQNYTDKQYFQQYPTIFHLRKELIESEEPHDVRLIYLALLNMFKHRGHFLNANLDGSTIGDPMDIVADLRECMSEYANFDFPGDGFAEMLESVLPTKELSNSRKVEEILGRAGISKSKNKPVAEIIKLLCGLQGKLSVIFTEENFDEEGKKFALSFRDGNYEDKENQACEILSEEAFEILLLIKQIHDWGILANIMKGNGKTYPYLSYARVDSYEKHGKDLRILKKLIRTYAPEKYNEMFRVMKDQNYSAYVGSVNSKKEIQRRGAKINNADFFQKVKKIISAMPDSAEKQYVLAEIEKETFLPKQLTAANGVIPNQVHKAELKAILKNAEKYLDFLTRTDETGLTVSEKIIKLFEFQIPYYVGPVFNDGQGTAWSVRKETGTVLPWNFEQKVDTKASAEKFIERMVNHCTYLNGETVLPKNSLLYERFVVLNELNNLSINGQKISVSLKQEIYRDLFRKGKKVKASQLEKYLKIRGLVENQDVVEISGIDGDFTNTLSNYAKFCSIYGADVLTYEQEIMSEQIIFWSTVYGDSKDFLRTKIEEEYGHVLSKEQIKRILGFKFRDWGRLSKALLELEGADKETGEAMPLISRMWDENYNMMELLSDRFTYKEEISSKAHKIEKTLSEMEYGDLDELYISAPVRRMVWQTILIIKELVKVLGCGPEKIFVEMARDADGSERGIRKDSRKKKFAELYKNCKEDGINWSQKIADTDETSFRSKKLYLYYTQKGRCMYTQEKIELSDLFNDNLYDIDHIYPRHFVKDDSIENNLVLVKKEKNAHKSDSYPLETVIRRSLSSWWKSLRDGGFITEEKYRRLTRNTEFTDEEQAAFISRQIVETRQGTKVVTSLLKQTFPDVEVVYVKAGNVSSFRQKYDLIKCREINDYHHANDAYLNIAVGNTYYVKFTKNPMIFVREYRKNPGKNQYHMEKIFDYNVQRNGQVAWIADKGESLRIVKSVMQRNTPLITRMSYEEHGGLADQNIRRAEEAGKVKGVGYIPIKTSDPVLKDTCKYGGFRKYTGAYFFLAEHVQKKKTVRTLEAMPLYLKQQLTSKEALEEYCRDTLGYEDPVVRMEKIKLYSLIKVDGFYLYLTGRTNNDLVVRNAIEMIIPYSDLLYVKKILNAVERSLNEEQLNFVGISREENVKLYDMFTDKFVNTIFRKRPNPVGSKLVAGREKFIGLNVERQIYVIGQILKLSGTENKGADLLEIGGVKNTGVMKINKRVTDRREFMLINRSVTGLYENQIDLLTV